MPITFPSVRHGSPFSTEHDHNVIDQLFDRLRSTVLDEPVEAQYKQLVPVAECSPFANVFDYMSARERRSMIIRSAILLYTYNVNELRAAIGTLTPLDTFKARAARRSIARLIDQTMMRELLTADIVKPVKSRESAEAVVPIEFEQFAPQWGPDPVTGLPALITTCHARFGGVAVYT